MWKIFVLFSCLLFYGCDNSSITGKECSITIETDNLGNLFELSEFSYIHVLAINKEDSIIKTYTLEGTNIDKNSINLDLPFGRYRLAFIMTQGENDIYLPEDGKLENIEIKLSQQNNEIYTAIVNVYLADNTETIPDIIPEKRTGKLKLHFSEISNEIKDVQITLSSIPTSIDFQGNDHNNDGNILKVYNNNPIEYTSFPVGKNKAELIIKYTKKDNTYVENFLLSEAIEKGKTIELNCIYNIDNDCFEIEIDQIFDERPPCDGNSNGINLLLNGDFEIWNSKDNRPQDWKFYKDGKDSIAIHVDNELFSGRKAVRLEGKTYIYQDIEITPNKCYIIKMNCLCTEDNFNWKYYCYWRKNRSTALPKEYNKEIQAPSYLKATDGWEDVFKDKVFRAPMDAKFLRIEVRTYGKEVITGQGLYIDAFSVEMIN